MTDLPVCLAAPDPLDRWPLFVRAVRSRLEAGRAEYGDRSFERPPTELLAELQEEALDLAGWGFVLWHRLSEMRDRLDDVAPDGWGD